MTQLSPTALEAAENALYSILDDDDWTGDRPNTIATAAISAYLAQAEKEGWVMVPREPEKVVIGNYQTRRGERVFVTAAAQNGGE